jgi:iron complex transport system substrate-binding protein
MFERIGGLLGATAREVAKRLVAGFGVTSTEIARRVGSRPPARIAHLEWIDPPYVAGHWIPELIARAGGCDVMGRPGRPSVRTTWQAIREAAPELMLAAPCGLPIDRARRELDILLENPGVRQAPWTTRPRIALSDGNAYFSRPGPRLESSMRIAAAAMCPELCGDLAPEGGWVEYSPRA